MADRSHLTPVRVTDYNGRSRTVYRNLRGRVGVLRDPARRGTEDEQKAFLRPIRHWWPEYGNYTRRLLGDPKALYNNKYDRLESVALAMDFVEHGDLPHREALWLLLDSTRRDDRKWLAHDSLRLAAHTRSQLQDPGERSEAQLSALVRAARGYRRHRGDSPLPDWDGKPITTAEQLASLAAVAEFTQRFADEAAGPITRTEPTAKGAAASDAVENPHLDLLLRERPQDLERITAYVAAHGIHPTDPEDAIRLRARLTSPETPAALLSGWL